MLAITIDVRPGDDDAAILHELIVDGKVHAGRYVLLKRHDPAGPWADDLMRVGLEEERYAAYGGQTVVVPEHVCTVRTGSFQQFVQGHIDIRVLLGRSPQVWVEVAYVVRFLVYGQQAGKMEREYVA